MRASVISTGLTLSDGEALTANHIIKWIFKALELPSTIENFTIDCTGRNTNDMFWDDLEVKTANLVFSLGDVSKLFEAVGNLFKNTIGRDDALTCWSTICHFSNDLHSKCTNDIFVLVSSCISATLLNEFPVYPDFEKNKIVMDSMIRCTAVDPIL